MTLVKTAKPNILTNMPPLWLQHDNISPHNRKKKKKNKRMKGFLCMISYKLCIIYNSGADFLSVQARCMKIFQF